MTRLNKKLLDGYKKELNKTGLNAYVVGAGSNGCADVLRQANPKLSRLAQRR